MLFTLYQLTNASTRVKFFIMALSHPEIDDNFDVNELNQTVLDLIDVLGTDLGACDLKWNLFVAAAQSYRYDSQLKPFPPAYQEGASVDIGKLLAVIDQTPSLRLIYQLLLDRNERILRKYHKVLRLLHWNFVTVSDPCLRTVNKENFDDVLGKCESTLPGPRPTHIFEVVPSENSALEKKFQAHALNGPTAFAYHGSRLYSFHSIMNYGLQQHLCKTGVFGEGIYLSSEMHVSLHFSPVGSGWHRSQFGKEISCLAICEFAEHAEHVQRHTKDQKSTSHKASTNVPEKYVIITNNEFVRLRYLVVFGQKQRTTKDTPIVDQHGHVYNWIVDNKSIVFMCFYAILLFAVGFGNTNNYNYLKNVFWRKVKNVFRYLKTTYLDDINLF